MSQTELPYVEVDRLRQGMFVHLELGWMDHPFTFSSFKIRTADQIETIRSIGLARVRYDPGRSDAQPQPAADPADRLAQALAAAAAADDDNPMAAAKRARMDVYARVREDIARGEKELVKAAGVVRGLTGNLISNPAKTVADAEKLVTLLVDSMLADQDVAIHLMNDTVAGEDVYYHSLNVSVLAMLLARAMKLDTALVRTIGIGALFHDVGHIDVPDRIRLKEPRNRAEENAYRQHCVFGVDIARRVGLAPDVVAIIGLHHEAMDGSGYPAGLRGDKIPLSVRIVAAVNAYDERCNPLDPSNAMTPHEALSSLYAKERARFDPQALSTLIRTLGVYPPGTVVKLSNDLIGLVISVNEQAPLKPSVAVYDKDVAREDAPIFDLARETDITIAKALRPAQLAPEVRDYLNPRKRVTYFFDSRKSGSPDKR